LKTESGDKSPHSKSESYIMDPLELKRDRIIRRLNRLSEPQLVRVENLLDQLECDKKPISSPFETKDWPHAPLHRLTGKGTFMVTAGTLNKEHIFCDAQSLGFMESQLLSLGKQYDWQLEAWAVFSNHYHFVGHAIKDANSLQPLLTQLHADTAREMNQRDGIEGRQVWFNFWDKELTFEKSYLARLNYVHQNPVKHGLVAQANQYRWCSAAWFEWTARPAQVKTIYSFKIDKLKVFDDFEVMMVK
jgi:putative transposase